jgi:recombinational DNA repair protein (RecF pathway)
VIDAASTCCAQLSRCATSARSFASIEFSPASTSTSALCRNSAERLSSSPPNVHVRRTDTFASSSASLASAAARRVGASAIAASMSRW